MRPNYANKPQMTTNIREKVTKHTRFDNDLAAAAHRTRVLQKIEVSKKTTLLILDGIRNLDM